MPVYMIRAGENGPVKIGYSHDPEIRLGQLQVSHWETLRIVRLFEGGEVEEVSLHTRFADQHIRGEWHHFSRSMLGDVGLVEIVQDEPAMVAPEIFSSGPEYADLMAPIRGRRGLITKIAIGLGITKAAVSMWSRVPAERVSDVSRITGFPVSSLRPDIFSVSNDGGVR